MIEPVPEPPPSTAPAADESAVTPGKAAVLTPEEQMERFERALYEADSGHQPC